VRSRRRDRARSGEPGCPECWLYIHAWTSVGVASVGALAIRMLDRIKVRQILRRRDKRIVRRPSPPQVADFSVGKLVGFLGRHTSRNDDLILGALRTQPVASQVVRKIANGGSSRSRRAGLAFCALRAGWPCSPGEPDGPGGLDRLSLLERIARIL